MMNQARYFDDGHKVEETYRENCQKCRGTGRFRMMGQCFACKGVGYKEYKTDARTRAAARQSSAARKVRTMAENLECVQSSYPAIWAWIERNRSTFEFARKMYEAAGQYGEFTDGQTAAMERLIERAKERAAENVARAESAPTIDTGALSAAFDKASAKGLKRPKMRFDGFTVSQAPASGKNAGALYVKADGEYLGKIQGGKLLTVRSCSDELRDRVAAAMVDPLAAAVAYGRRTGNCAICGRSLTDKVSVERGIGPICADNVGF